MSHLKMYSLIISLFSNNTFLLPEARQHLLGLVDQFFLGNPEKRLQSLIYTVYNNNGNTQLIFLNPSKETNVILLELVSTDKQGFGSVFP